MARMTPRWWAAVFFASLALNVLLAGIIATAYYNRDRDLVHRMTVYTVPWALRVVGDEVITMARRTYVKYQATMTQNRQVLARDYAAVNEILDAPQFNREAFSEALAKLRADITIAQATMHEGMAEFVSGLTPDQRGRLSDFVNEWWLKREQRAIRRDELIEQKERSSGAN